MNQRNDFYVYGAYLKESNILFYIGKGSGKRIKSFSKRDRSKRWFNFLKGREFYTVILFSGMSNKEALNMEEYLISITPAKLINKNKSSKVIPIDIKVFSELYYIDPSSPSGLRWRSSGGRGRCNHRANDPAGSFMSKTGYWTVVLNKRRVLAHRVVYALYHKAISEDMYIDHIDGNSLNNCITNLRQVTPSENARNKALNNSNGLPSGMYIAKNVWNGNKTRQTNRLVFKYTTLGGKSKQKSICLDDFETIDSAVTFMTTFIKENLKDILLENKYTHRHFNLEK